MKPTSKVIKTFMTQTENFGLTYDIMIAHCEDGSIWKTTQDILYVEDEDWECILEAPESQAKDEMEEIPMFKGTKKELEDLF